ncbi:ATP-binding protein [Microbacterium sp. X-17]|uniref:sensor histidine kinase n=1 Tax=Microbacterium sp. X-17 TaxID=3144404 RepID=UPI0031F48C39
MTESPASDVAKTTAEDDAVPWRGLDAILPTRRLPLALSLVLFLTVLVQGLLDPIAFILDGRREWPYAIPLWGSILLVLVFCAAQAALLLLTTRWAAVAVAATMAVYLAALFVLNAPAWVAPMQLAVIAALFLFGARRTVAMTLTMLLAIIVAQVLALIAWAGINELTPGTATGFILGQAAGAAAAFTLAAVVGLWWGAQSRRVARLRAQAEKERRDQEARLAHAREAERSRILQELHDVAGQHITGLLSLTDAALMIADQYSPDALTLLTEARSEARYAAASLFSALHDLRATDPTTAEATPGVLDLADLVEFWRKRGVRVHMQTSGAIGSLPAVISTSAYRIAQEALTNAVKHSPGTSIDLDVDITDDQLRIEVTNGPSRRGLPDPASFGLGWGLTGLQERVGLLGGSLSVGPTERGGWRVHATIPIMDAASESATAGYVS